MVHPGLTRASHATAVVAVVVITLASSAVGYAGGRAALSAPYPGLTGATFHRQALPSIGGSDSISSAGYVSATLCLFDNKLLSGNGICPNNPNAATEAFIPDSIAVDTTNGDIYVSNEGGGNVSVINDTTNHITSFVGAGFAPTAVALGDQGSRLYVTNWASNNVTVIDTQTNNVVGTIPVGIHPTGVVFDANTGDMFVANQYSDNVSVIDGDTSMLIGNISGVGPYPSQAAYDSRNTFVYVVVQDGVTVLNGSTQSVVTKISIPAVGWAAGDFYDPQNEYLYVASYNGNNVTIVNTTTNAVTGTIDAKANTEFGFALDLQTGLLYEAMTTRNVSVYNTTDNTLVGSIDYGPTGPGAIAYDANNGLIYVANWGWDTITIITPGVEPAQGSGTPPFVFVLAPVVTTAVAGALVWYAVVRKTTRPVPSSNSGSK